MRKYQVIHGKELGIPGNYKISYFYAEDLGELTFEMTKEYNATSAVHAYNVMAGGFGQYLFHLYKDGKKVAEYYAIAVDKNNNYILAY